MRDGSLPGDPAECEFEVTGATRIDQAVFCEAPARVHLDDIPYCLEHAEWTLVLIKLDDLIASQPPEQTT